MRMQNRQTYLHFAGPQCDLVGCRKTPFCRKLNASTSLSLSIPCQGISPCSISIESSRKNKSRRYRYRRLRYLNQLLFFFVQSNHWRSKGPFRAKLRPFCIVQKRQMRRLTLGHAAYFIVAEKCPRKKLLGDARTFLLIKIFSLLCTSTY